MRAAGYQPDRFTYASMLDAASNAGDIQGIKQIYASMEQNKHPLELRHLNFLMRAYALNCKRARSADIKQLIAAADDLWLEMTTHPEWVAVPLFYNAYLSVFTTALRIKRAEVLFNSMREAGAGPNQTSYWFMISMYMDFKKTTEAEDLYRQMIDSGLGSNAHFYGMMINGFARANYFRSALRYLHDMIRYTKIAPMPFHTRLLARKTYDYPHIRTVITLLLKERGIEGTAALPYFRSVKPPSILFSRQKGGEPGALRLALKTEGARLDMGLEHTQELEPTVFRWNRPTSRPKRHGRTKSFRKGGGTDVPLEE
jgi:pentatricopeptide repeat protein